MPGCTPRYRKRACPHVARVDPLDNLRIADQGSRQYRYSYDAITNRLSQITNPAGATQISFTHDARGNVTSKTTGGITQTLAFDHGNRLSYVAGQEYYRYDGQSRRVNSWSSSTGINNLYVYGQGGQLMYTSDARNGRDVEYVYLGNTQVAQRRWAAATGWTTTWQHTDSLGSIVAETDATGAVVARNAYAPYGEEFTAGPKVIDGTGYTGHVMDRVTGLTYMQQRYYDPVIGRFLSVDPVAANPNSGAMFNRYSYAFNNPLKFVDPDGRIPGAGAAYIGDGMLGRDARDRTKPQRTETATAEGANSEMSSDKAKELAELVRDQRNRAKEIASGKLDSYCATNTCVGTTSTDLKLMRVVFAKQLFYPGEGPKSKKFSGASIDRTTTPPTVYIYAGGVALGFGPNANGLANVLVHELRHLSPEGTRLYLQSRGHGDYETKPNELDAFDFQKKVMGTDYVGW